MTAATRQKGALDSLQIPQRWEKKKWVVDECFRVVSSHETATWWSPTGRTALLSSCLSSVELWRAAWTTWLLASPRLTRWQAQAWWLAPGGKFFLRVIFLLKEWEGSERDDVLEPRNDGACSICSPSRPTPWPLGSHNEHGRWLLQLYFSERGEAQQDYVSFLLKKMFIDEKI